MVRTLINKLPFALLLLFLFASCDKEEYGQEDNTGGGSEQIHFEIAVGITTATSSGLKTRVITSPTYESTFENGDEIGVFIVKGSGGLQSSGNWVDNMKLTYNNGTWSLPTTLYYPTGDDLLHFYAYYPHKVSVVDALNMNIVGLTDQSSAANLLKSDLLSASTLNVGKNSNPVQLNFSHVLTMVELSVSGGGAGAQMSSEVAVTLEGCIPNVSLNLSTKAANASGGVTSVKMRRVEQSGDANYLTRYTYRAFVPTQTVFTGAELFRFSQTQGTITRTLSHRLAGNVALYPGEVKPYNITLQSASSTHAYAVGDYYPYKGFPILGVVFEVSNGGVNGKILSFDEDWWGATWGDPTVDEQAAGVANIRDKNDGQAGTKNLIAMRKDQGNFATSYGAFNWIYQTKNKGNVNGIWYMPASNELISFRNVWYADQTGFDAKLTDAGGLIIYADLYDYYWSLSETSMQYSEFYIPIQGYVYDYGYDKSTRFRTRPIAKF